MTKKILVLFFCAAFLAIPGLTVAADPSADDQAAQNTEAQKPAPEQPKEDPAAAAAAPPEPGNIQKQSVPILGQATPESAPTAQDYVDESINYLMPLGADEIKRYRQRSTERNKATSPTVPSLGTRTVLVSLQPGTAPQTVRTTANVATSVVFHDSTGQPWPISSVTNGGSGFFQILRPETPEGNLINIVPTGDNASASVVVTLVAKDIPLVIKVVSDDIQGANRNADAMVLFQVKAFGPKAEAPVFSSIKETVSSDMISILDQVKPASATRLRFEPSLDGCELFTLNGRHYLRTTDMLQWPASMSVVSGAGGVKCYELPSTPSIMVSRQGQTVKLKIVNFEGK